MSHRLIDNKPEFWDNHGRPAAVKYGIEVTVLQDDVTTVCFLTNSKTNNAIATGYARRHPSDARNPEIGHTIAIARAFAIVAERYAAKAEELMTPAPDPMAEPLKAMKRANRAEQQRRKNEKRRTAREAYLAKNGVPKDEISDALGRSFGDWTG